jgi:hypothetical protein
VNSPPDRDRWRRVESILDAALDLEPAERDGYLRRACPDAETLREVLELLGSCERPPGFLDGGALAWTADILAGADGDAHDAVPERLGRYEILRELGRGGMGVVYLAHDPRLQRRVAVKLLPPHLSSDPAASRRLEREARAASAIQHPNVVAVYDVGESAEGRPYLVMAHHAGRTLRDLLERGALPAGRALAVGRQVAAGLAAAHAAGVVHRDVKPANVLVDAAGTARVVDFGIALARGAGDDRSLLGMGTAAYMSPEQARGEEPDPRSDVWALGVLLCEMRTGKRPFEGDAAETVLRAVVDGEPALPDGLDGPLRDIVARCIRKNPGERPADAGRVAALLDAVADPAGDGVRRVGVWPGVAAAAVMVLLAVGTVTALRSLRRADAPPALGGTAVLPLVPVAPDTSLERLGRELAVTLSAALSSVSEAPLIDPGAVLSRVRAGPGPSAIEDAARLGALRVISGSLIRLGADSVRAEVALVAVEGGATLARAGATAGAGEITALTDSLTLRILRATWPRGEVPTPSVAGLMTASVPALGAYLEGERTMAGGDFVAAVDAFERAFAHDSTFWFAYWRSLYPRSHEGTPGADGALVEALWEHRHELPRPDRLLMEATNAPRLTERLELARTLTEEHPTYWPGWWEYADRLIHDGPYLGTVQSEAKVALQRVIDLQPAFAPAWQHRLWLDLYARDTASIARSLERVRSLAAPTGQFYAQEELRYYGVLEEFVRAGGSAPAVAAREARGLVARPPPASPDGIGHGMLEFDLPVAQIEIGEALLSENPGRPLAVAARIGIAKAWASRGDWEAALGALDGLRAMAGPEEAGLPALQLTAAGVILGHVDAARLSAARRRAAAASAADSAELLWLDGLAAFARRDAPGVERARGALAAGAYAHGGLLEESLRGFRQALEDERLGAEAIARLEERKADTYGYARYAPAHPYMSAIHRIWAGRILAREGETERARRLLTWHQAVRWGRTNPEEWINRMLGPLALLERAEIADLQDRPADARALYAEFLARYDRPDAAGAELVERARAGASAHRDASHR